VDEGPGLDRVDEEEWGRFLRDELGTRAARAGVWRRALATPGALEAVRAIGSALAGFVVPAEAIAADARYVPAGTGAPFRGEVGARPDRPSRQGARGADHGPGRGRPPLRRALPGAAPRGRPRPVRRAAAADARSPRAPRPRSPRPGGPLSHHAGGRIPGHRS